MTYSKNLYNESFIRVPTLNTSTNKWSLTDFGDRSEFRDYVDAQFKEPGLYGFNNSEVWNEQGRRFFDKGYYTNAPKNTKDYIRYWETERLKCRKGVIIDDFYLPRDYYMWINFLPIFNKEEKRFTLPNVWDVQYHMALYELRCELHYKHAAILKKRQIASSYFHMAKIINQYWFEEGSVCKVGASKENYVNDSWRFLNEYRDHLNQYCGWYRANDPNKLRDWQQRQKVTDENNRDMYIGLKSIIKGTTFDKDPTAGVGGPCSIFFHEEGGIAPKADLTYRFMDPALKSGATTTGLFIIAGSVGDLTQCQPLRGFIRKPHGQNILAVPYNLDPKDDITESGLFIPQHWSMSPFIDGQGNSLTEQAKEYILENRKQKEKDLSMRDYQIMISQEPLTIEEAFAVKHASRFPTHLISKRRDKIREGGRNYACVELEKDSSGNITHTLTKKSPNMEWPINPKTLDKEGSIQVFNQKFPKKDAKWGAYLAGIDPVDIGKTHTSDSLFSIYIYEQLVENTSIDSEGKKNVKLEGDEIAACWTGRFDDVNKTNSQAELFIEWYGAWGVCENNIKSFIQHMMKKKKTKYLATPKDLPFTKEIVYTNGNSATDFGVRMNETIKNYLFEGVIDYLTEEIGEREINGKFYVIYGVDKIPDEMLLQEMLEYTDDANTDRLIAFALALAFAKSRQANGMFVKQLKTEKPTKPVKMEDIRSMFNTIGVKSKGGLTSKPRGGFRNLH